MIGKIATRVRTAFIWAILASATALAQSNPVPFIDQPLVPMSLAPGGSGFTLTVNGAGFTSSSVVNWSGIPLPTTFVSKAQVTAMVAASDIASPHTAWITVSNAAPGGGISNVDYFQIASPHIHRSGECANTGDATRTITSIAISGTNASDFTQTNNCGSVLAVNATCQIRVTFSPTGGGARGQRADYRQRTGQPADNRTHWNEPGFLACHCARHH
jgi:hypothetical protein